MASPNKMRVVLLASEWRTKRDELSTFNRELAIQLAKHPDVQVSVFLPRCDQDEKNEALSHKITLVQAKRRPGFDNETQWLCFPPKDLQIDFVIGHGVELGHQAQVIQENRSCKWVQFVYNDPEERGMLKDCPDAISDGEKKRRDEVDLCVSADFVVAVGSKVAEAYRPYFHSCDKDQNVFVLTPGIFTDFSNVAQSSQDGSKCRVLAFGHGSAGDFSLKGFDIAAKAVAKFDDAHLIVVGAEKQDEVAGRLKEYNIPASRLRVRERFQKQFSEADLVIMPSRTEGFGLTALEAISAGLPVLVSANSGFGEAMKEVAFGWPYVIDSEDAEVWAKEIRKVWTKSREIRLQELKAARDSYAAKYNWEEQCRDLVERMRRIVNDPAGSGVTIPEEVEHQPDADLSGAVYQLQLTKQPQPSDGGNVSKTNEEGAVPLSTGTAKRSGKRKSQSDSDQGVNEEGASPTKKDPPNVLGTIPNLATLVRLIIEAQDLSDEQQKTVYEFLALHTQAYVKSRNFSAAELELVGAFIEHVEEVYNVALKSANVGSLEIVLHCPTLKSLEHLWSDYLSGHLNEVAEKFLITDEIKRTLKLETIRLKTTIEEENYLKCRKALMEMSGASVDEISMSAALKGMSLLDSAPQDSKEIKSSSVKDTGVEKSTKHEALSRSQGPDAETKHMMSGSQSTQEADENVSVKKESRSISGTIPKPGASVDEIPTSAARKRMSLVDSAPQDSKQLKSPSVEDTGVEQSTRHEALSTSQRPDAEARQMTSGGQSTKEADEKVSVKKESRSISGTVSKPGAAGSTFFPSQQTESVEGARTRRTDASSDFHGDKKRDTSWMVRAEKAKASRTALHKASISGQYETVKILLDDGEDVDQKDQFSLTPLHLACWYGQELVVGLLLEHGANVNAADRFLRTPLQKAERQNHLSIVKLLLKNNACPSYQQPVSLKSLSRKAFLSIDRRTSFNLLQRAVFEGDYHTVIKAHAFLDNFLKEMNVETTGHDAKVFPGMTAVDILLSLIGKRRCYVEINKLYQTLEDIEKYNTLADLHRCARSDDAEKVIELVLNDGMEVNIPALCNRTPLLWAITSSSMMIKTLIDLGADVNAQRTDDKVAPLLLAARWNSYMASRLLLEHGADPNIQASEGGSPLHYCVSKGFFEVSQFLIKIGCNINLRRKNGRTPLHDAIANSRVNLVKLLLENNADSNIQDDEGNTPLHLSVCKGNFKISQLLIEAGCSINTRNKNGRTPLHYAVRIRQGDLVKLLLKNNADSNIQDAEGDTPLHLSFGKGNLEISQLLIKAGCNINTRNKNGRTPLHVAVLINDKDLVKLLLENNADANIQDGELDTPLFLSVRREKFEISQLLIEIGCKINLRDKTYHTPLYIAVKNKYPDDQLIKLLLECNADLTMRYIEDPKDRLYLVRGKDRGRLTWCYVVVERHLQGLFLKQTKGGSLDVADFGTVLEPVWGENPPETNWEKVNEKVDAMFKEIPGKTLLHVASRNNNTEITDLLVKYGADVNARDAAGFTPLHIAAIHGNMKVVKKLVDLKADVSQVTVDGKDAVDLAHLNEETEIEEYLRPRITSSHRTERKEKEQDVVTYAIILSDAYSYIFGSSRYMCYLSEGLKSVRL